jgi:hypothetical protein
MRTEAARCGSADSAASKPPINARLAKNEVEIMTRLGKCNFLDWYFDTKYLCERILLLGRSH